VKQQIIFVALLIGLTVMVAPVAAQKGGRGTSSEPESTPMGIQHTSPNAGSKYADFLYGVVKELNKDDMVLTKTKLGADQTFKFTKKTKFINDGKTSTLEALKLGAEVWVDADQDKKTGDFIVKKVVTGVFIM
jgi:hypothetical protein